MSHHLIYTYEKSKQFDIISLTNNNNNKKPSSLVNIMKSLNVLIILPNKLNIKMESNSVLNLETMSLISGVRVIQFPWDHVTPCIDIRGLQLQRVTDCKSMNGSDSW